MPPRSVLAPRHDNKAGPLDVAGCQEFRDDRAVPKLDAVCMGEMAPQEFHAQYLEIHRWPVEHLREGMFSKDVKDDDLYIMRRNFVEIAR